MRGKKRTIRPKQENLQLTQTDSKKNSETHSLFEKHFFFETTLVHFDYCNKNSV